MSTQLFSTQRGDRESNRIRLRDILPQAQVVGADEIFFHSCCGVWRDCQSDDLFVAIVDADEDGHEFTQEAIARGASAVVTERLLTTRRPQCIVPDTREAYGLICQALAGHPSQRLATIAVSGTDGKTVTSHLIRQVLQMANVDAGLASSIEVNFGAGKKSVPPKQLNSPQLAQQLTQMALANCHTAVFEVSSIALAKRSLAGVDLDIAVLTNIRQGTPGFHGSPKNYRRAILRLLDHLKPGGVVAVNADDPTCHFLLKAIDQPTLTFGMKQEANVTGVLIERTPSEQTFLIKAGSDSVPVKTAIVGDQHILNCLAAAAVGLAQGIDLVTIASGLGQVDAIPGRLERVECGQDFGVWIDSAKSPSQLATAVRTIKQITQGKLWCVASISDDQTVEMRNRMGEVLERAADRCVLTKNALEQVIDYEPMHQVLDGFESPGGAELIPNRFRAIEWVLQRAKPGDAVLITGCGEQPFALVGDENWTIGDRDVCEAWLYDNASLSPIDVNLGDGPDTFHIDDYR
ncbi:MAG: UDP-N-acetylmuramyl-tripeptide synthetase [Planctomycetota bacterium]